MVWQCIKQSSYEMKFRFYGEYLLSYKRLLSTIFFSETHCVILFNQPKPNPLLCAEPNTLLLLYTRLKGLYSLVAAKTLQKTEIRGEHLGWTVGNGYPMHDA